jgi:hypothetical protein
VLQIGEGLGECSGLAVSSEVPSACGCVKASEEYVFYGLQGVPQGQVIWSWVWG